MTIGTRFSRLFAIHKVAPLLGPTVFFCYPARLNSQCEQTLTNPQLFIEGGQPLQGSVRVGGSKNAADYALAACLLTGDEVILDNVPEIEDVRLMTEILAALGAQVQYDGAGVWRIKAASITRYDAPREMVINQRASFLVMGPLLARFGQAACCSPG